MDKDGKYLFLQNGRYWTSTLLYETSAFSVLVESSHPDGKPVIFSDLFKEELAVSGEEPLFNGFNEEYAW